MINEMQRLGQQVNRSIQGCISSQYDNIQQSGQRGEQNRLRQVDLDSLNNWVNENPDEECRQVIKEKIVKDCQEGRLFGVTTLYEGLRAKYEFNFSNDTDLTSIPEILKIYRVPCQPPQLKF